MKFKNFCASILMALSVPCLASCEEEGDYSRFLTGLSSQTSKENALQVLKKVSQEPKTEILHDYGVMMPGCVYADFGWDFPPIFAVQSELLDFCASQPSRKRFMDIGAGKGSDTVAMLLTNKTHVTAYELQKAQFSVMQERVKALVHEANPAFNLDACARFRQGDFLSVSFVQSFQGAYTGMNLNKVAHFWDNDQLATFVQKAAFLLEKGVGRLFITVVTPTPGDEFSEFVHANDSGLVFFQRKDLLNNTWTGVVGKPTITTRRPRAGEKAGHMYQTVLQEGSKAYAVTDRVMHYHTEATLARALGDKFKIIKVINLAPKDIHADAFESMLSIVAQRTEL